MKLIKLPFINDLHKNLTGSSKFLQVILGPRQVGKTTTILDYLQKHHEGQHHYVSADGVFNATPAWVREQWDKAQRDKKLLAIDEIQKCHNWAEVLKALWDEAQRTKRMINCVLLGSSSLGIQRGLSESLTGRFQLLTAYHWNARESEEGYGLSFDEFLKFGGYPGAYPFVNSSEWQRYLLNSVVGTVIEKDILQYQSVRNPALFKQAFEILMGYPAMEISYTKLLGQLQDKGNVEIIKHYIDLYQGAYLIRVLEKYAPSRIKVKSSSPKILPLAPCLYYLTHLDRYTSDELGHVFEAIVGAQLVRTEAEIFYWREGKYEVDFVVKRGKKLWAIEVKSGRRRVADGMAAFTTKYSTAKPVIISQENYRLFEKAPMAFLDE